MSIRAERVASLLRQELGEIFSREYNDAASGFITVTDVRLTGDLRHARVFYSVLGPLEERARVAERLEADAQHLRSVLAGRLTLRFMPALEFILDTTLDRVERINTIIRRIHDGPVPPPDEGGTP